MATFTPFTDEQKAEILANTAKMFTPAVVESEWATPSHEEVDLTTVTPEELGLDPFDTSDPLVCKIHQAHDEQEEAAERARVALEEEIQKVETSVQDLNMELPSDVEFDIPVLPENPLEKLAILKETEKALYAAVQVSHVSHVTEDELPITTFGNPKHTLTKIDFKSGTVWVDYDGVNFEDGKRILITPEIQNLIDQTKKRAAEEWLTKKKAGTEPYLQYAMTKEEYTQEIKKDYPVLPLLPQLGPKWNDGILYGITGDIIRKASACCEAHPAGMLVDLLVSLGSIIGRGPYFNIGATKHFTNEFMARVGNSSVSRKGTGRDAIDEILKYIDGEWFSNHIESGFGSGEAIVSRIRDDSVEQKMDHKTKKFVQINVPGIKDKRLCIREGELASIFVLAGKVESRADIIFRGGWDGTPLRNVVKGKSKDGFSNSAKCEEPHLSISGDTTVSELRQKMPKGSENNGFGNRFLFVYVYRTKHCPHGGPMIDWSQEITKLYEIIHVAKQVSHVSMTDSARMWWNENYSRLENDSTEDLAGKMTSRGPAHIRRIAMLYALLDGKDTVTREHFQAAKKLWNYCDASAVFIFSGYTAEQHQILEWLDSRGGQATYNQVRDELYYRNKPVAEIRAELAQLVKQKKLILSGEIYSKMGSVGLR